MAEKTFERRDNFKIELKANGQPPRVLVIDDENAEILGVMIRNAGFIVDIAETARQGIEMAQMLMPDIIVLDLQMPREGFDGMDARHYFKNHPKLKDVPIVVVSGVTVSDDLLKRAMMNDVAAYLEKPVGSPELVDTLCKIMEIRSRKIQPCKTVRRGRLIFNYDDGMAASRLVSPK